jgi:hypothetical protein
LTIINGFGIIRKNSKFYIVLNAIIIERGDIMDKTKNTIFVGVDTVVRDLGVSKPRAYKIIKELNEKLKNVNPNAIIITGKVNRNWYKQACLMESEIYRKEEKT